jgi:hypothetical protein
MYCPKCGTLNDDNAFRCIQCGTVIQQVPSVVTSVKKTNTAVVVLVVVGTVIGIIVIISILVAIAIPGYLGYQMRTRNSMSQKEIRNACYAAATIFKENPTKILTIDDLRRKGIGTNPEVELVIDDGTMVNLSMHAKHSTGNKTYVADHNCNIKETQP